jgi:predicted dehydrogenase
MSDAIRVGIVGTQFMGRAHSNAYQRVGTFFDVAPPIMRAACDVEPTGLAAFAKRFGWQTTDDSWQKLVQRDDIDLVDICTPNALHMPIVVAAAKAKARDLREADCPECRRGPPDA